MTVEPRTATVLTTPVLRRLNNDAASNSRSDHVSDDFWTRVDYDGYHLVTLALVFGPTVRLCILAKMAGTIEPVEIFLEVDSGLFYDSLQKVELDSLAPVEQKDS